MTPLRIFGFCALMVWAFVSLPAAAAKPSKSEPLQGVVTQVIDGDTLRFNVAGQPAIAVRLAQIDAPELCQAGGAEARRALSDLTLNKPASSQAAFSAAGKAFQRPAAPASRAAKAATRKSCSKARSSTV